MPLPTVHLQPAIQCPTTAQHPSWVPQHRASCALPVIWQEQEPFLDTAALGCARASPSLPPAQTFRLPITDIFTSSPNTSASVPTTAPRAGRAPSRALWLVLAPLEALPTPFPDLISSSYGVISSFTPSLHGGSPFSCSTARTSPASCRDTLFIRSQPRKLSVPAEHLSLLHLGGR